MSELEWTRFCLTVGLISGIGIGVWLERALNWIVKR